MGPHSTLAGKTWLKGGHLKHPSTPASATAGQNMGGQAFVTHKSFESFQSILQETLTRALEQGAHKPMAANAPTLPAGLVCHGDLQGPQLESDSRQLTSPSEGTQGGALDGYSQQKGGKVVASHPDEELVLHKDSDGSLETRSMVAHREDRSQIESHSTITTTTVVDGDVIRATAVESKSVDIYIDVVTQAIKKLQIKGAKVTEPENPLMDTTTKVGSRGKAMLPLNDQQRERINRVWD